jgi:hypothetical protein
VENSPSSFIVCLIEEIKSTENRSNKAKIEGIVPVYSGIGPGD